MGGYSTDVEKMVSTTTGSGAMKESRVTVTTSMADIAEVTGVHVGAKGIHTTQPTPRADRDTSAVIKPTTMELV